VVFILVWNTEVNSGNEEIPVARISTKNKD
jgi:hypothetical protein